MVRDVDIVVRHMPGECMGVVDALSRRSFDQRARSRVEGFTTQAAEREVKVPRQMMGPPIKI